jgi:hypothetical protein
LSKILWHIERAAERRAVVMAAAAEVNAGATVERRRATVPAERLFAETDGHTPDRTARPRAGSWGALFWSWVA